MLVCDSFLNSSSHPACWNLPISQQLGGNGSVALMIQLKKCLKEFCREGVSLPLCRPQPYQPIKVMVQCSAVLTESDVLLVQSRESLREKLRVAPNSTSLQRGSCQTTCTNRCEGQEEASGTRRGDNVGLPKKTMKWNKKNKEERVRFISVSSTDSERVGWRELTDAVLKTLKTVHRQ